MAGATLNCYRLGVCYMYTIQPCTVSLQGTVSHSNATKVALKALAVWMLGVLHNVQHQTITLFMGTFQRRIHDYFLIHFIMIRLAHDTFAIIMNYQKKKKKKGSVPCTHRFPVNPCAHPLWHCPVSWRHMLFSRQLPHVLLHPSP